MSDESTDLVAKFRKPKAKHRLRPKDTHRFVEELIDDDFHAKRVLSLANGVTGTIHGATLGIHAIGQGLAQAQGLNPKHAVKQAGLTHLNPREFVAVLKDGSQSHL